MRHLFSAAFLTAVFTVIFGSSCGKKASNVPINTPHQDYIPQRGDFTFKTRVCCTEEDGDVCYDTIITYLTDAQGHTDTLWSWAAPLDTSYWSKEAFGKIEEEDYNFDGIPDLQVCLGPTNSNGNETYDAFLWDEAQHKFTRIPGYDTLVIYSPVVNAGDKQIVSFWRLDDEVEYVKYEWKDGRLVEVERTQEKYGEDYEE